MASWREGEEKAVEGGVREKERGDEGGKARKGGKENQGER